MCIGKAHLLRATRVIPCYTLFVHANVTKLNNVLLLSLQHFTVPLQVTEYLNTIRPPQESLRRFSHTPHSEAMPTLVGCSYEDCLFEADTIEAMMQHQAAAKHPGWGSIPPKATSRSWVCGKCASSFQKWGVLYVHLATHSLPYTCPRCPYKAGRLYRLKKHMEKYHGEVLDNANRWSLQQK